MFTFGNARLTRWSLLLALAAGFAACTGGTTTTNLPRVTTPMTAVREHPGQGKHRAQAVIAIPARFARSKAAMHVRLRSFASAPIADEALQIGMTYANHETWAIDPYTPVDPSCGMLNWAYTNTIPGVTVTLNPAQTSLTGSTSVSFTQIPVGTTVQQWSNTITPTCTNAMPTGVLPIPTTYTIYTVILDIGQVPQVAAAPTIITNAVATPIVGQFIELEATPQPNVSFVKVQWTPIPGDTVQTYTQTRAKASFTMLDKTDLNKKLVDFYWIHGSDNSPLALGVYAVFPTFNSHCRHGCTGAENYWGQTNANAMANVLAPTGVAITSETGAVAAGKYPPGCFYFLHFGTVATGCGVAQKVGIDWKMKATAPAGGAGEIDGTQLIDRKDVAGPFPHVSPAPTSYPGTAGFELDSCIQYGDPHDMNVPIGASAEATYASSDSPGFPLRPQWKLFTAMDTFVQYFVYKPSDQAGAPAGRMNIWVPLGHLDWHWSGSATNSGTPVLHDNWPGLQPLSRNPAWYRLPIPSGANPDVTHPIWALTRHANSVDPHGVKAKDPLPTWKALYRPSNVGCPPGA